MPSKTLGVPYPTYPFSSGNGGWVMYAGRFRTNGTSAPDGLFPASAQSRGWTVTYNAVGVYRITLSNQVAKGVVDAIIHPWVHAETVASVGTHVVYPSGVYDSTNNRFLIQLAERATPATAVNEDNLTIAFHMLLRYGNYPT